MRIVAREDATLRPVVVAARPLRYDDGGDPAHDRTPHVRAASGLAWLDLGEGPRLVLAQDDTSYLAVIDPEPEVPAVRAIALDHAVDGRRVFESRLDNKHHKLDLEACVALSIEGVPSVLVVGSGSSPARERFVIVDGRGRARILAAPRFYEALRAERGFSGSELNLEGAVALDGSLILFQRGNGAPDGPHPPLDATCVVSLEALLGHVLHDRARPALARIATYELGAIDGVRLTFTDAMSLGDRLVFLAGAEESPNVIDDGRVVGVALGWMGTDGGDVRWGRIRTPDGSPYRGKVEGLAPRRPGVDDGRFWAVIDKDDPDAPSELLAIELG